MKEIHFMTGIASSGKSTRMMSFVEDLQSKYESEEIVESYLISKKNKIKDFSIGLYFSEINLLALGRVAKIRNGEDRWTSFDGLATYGLRMYEIDQIVVNHSDKIIVSEGNIDYSPNRKLPKHLHSLGFDKVVAYCLLFDDFDTFFHRLNARRVSSGRKPLDRAVALDKFNDQKSVGGFVDRFKSESLEGDRVFVLSASSPIDSFLETFTNQE